MANKKLLIGTVLLVIIAGVALLKDKLSGPTAAEDPRLGTHVLTDQKLEGVSGITIKDGDISLALKKDDKGSWILPDAEGFPASADKVVQFLESLTKAKIVRRISARKEKLASLGLDGKKAVNLAGAGGAILQLNLGKDRSGGGQFISFAGEDTSWLIDQTLAPGYKADEWEYRKLANVKEDDVKGVSFLPPLKSKNKAVKILRDKKEDSFRMDGAGEKEKVAEAEMKAAAGLLKDLGFTNREPVGDKWDKALSLAPKVEFQTFAGKTWTMTVVEEKAAKKEDESKFYMHVETDDGSGLWLAPFMKKWKFEVSSWQGKKFIKGRQDFLSGAG